MAFYRCMGGNGGGTTPTSITPSNSSPAAMSSGGVYQPTANGYAIESYQEKTPSDSTPPSVASGDIVKMGGAGYLYASQASTVKTGTTVSTARNNDIVINTGVTNIKHFVWMTKVANSNYIQTVEYYHDVFPNKYNASCIGTSASIANRDFGNAVQNTCMLTTDTDIANGIVVIHTYNSTYGDVNGGVWFAE